jgi:hypothetical protein
VDAYLGILTKVLEKSVEAGAPDEKIMDRIERLLGVKDL